MREQDLRDALDFAEQLADDARGIALRYFRQPLTIERKADATPVTQADREIELGLRAAIAERFPEHGIFGEEFANSNGKTSHVWVIDPIDGTKSFATGKPLFGTLIALYHKNVAQLGIIEASALAERWLGVRGAMTQYNGLDCHNSGCSQLEYSRLITTSASMFTGMDVKRFEALRSKVGFCSYGGDCYNYGLLASGHTDLVVESDLKPFDYAALVCVIQGAGGVITDWQGKALKLESDGRVLAAATPELHAQALAILTAE